MSSVAIADDNFEDIDIGFETPEIKVCTTDLLLDTAGMFQAWIKATRLPLNLP